MATPILAVTLALLFVGASASFAADKEKAQPDAAAKQKKAAPVVPLPQQEHTYITGSFIRRPVMRNGIVTDFSSPVSVIDSTMIQRSGASNLKQALLKYGSGR